MIETIDFKTKTYPKFQAEGYAAQFAIPFASKVCTGIGLDIGCNRLEWMFSGKLYESSQNKYKDNFAAWLSDAKNMVTESYPIDPIINNFNATSFPDYCENLDYIFSSHCLEHLQNWVGVLDYWLSKLKLGGVLFLYLPDYSQEYWRPWNNRKHLNIFTPDIIVDYLKDKGCKKIFNSGTDLNNSFIIIAEK
jgi:trans-aconitate methyltransferase